MLEPHHSRIVAVSHVRKNLVVPPCNNSLGFFRKSARITPAFLTGTTQKWYSLTPKGCSCIKTFAKSVRGPSSLFFHFQPYMRFLAFAGGGAFGPTAGSASLRIPLFPIHKSHLWIRSTNRRCPLRYRSHLYNALSHQF